MNLYRRLRERQRFLSQPGIAVDWELLASQIWNDRRRPLIFGVGFAVFGVIIALVLPPLYMAGMTLYPSNANSAGSFGNLQGLAANFGVNVGGGLGQEYNIPEVLLSRRAMNQLVRYRWQTQIYAEPTDLMTFWKMGSANGLGGALRTWINRGAAAPPQAMNIDSVRSEELAVERLRSRIELDENKVTGLVRVVVRMEERQLAVDVARQLARITGEVISEMNNAVERQNRVFIEGRMLEVETELSRREVALSNFKMENRSLQGSPQLELEADRLERNVRVSTEMYLTLVRQYEIARIDEARKEAAIVILDAPGIPALKNRPRRRLLVVGSATLGLVFGLGWTVTMLFWRTPETLVRHETSPVEN